MSISVLEAFPYPWPSPEAQELHLALCEIYPTTKGAGFVAEKQGIPSFRLNLDQSALFVWKDILDAAATAKITRPLVQYVRDQNKTNARARFLEDLLANNDVVTTNLRAADVKLDDTVGEPEALLYHDDLTLSAGRIPWLIEVLGTIRTLAPSICRLVCNYNGPSGFGTGFRIGPDLLLTNWHVLHNPHINVRATAVTAQFDYEEDATGTPRPSIDRACDIASMVVGNIDNDWGVIRVATPLPDSIPIIKLSTAVDPVKQQPAFVVQHPAGAFKRIGYVRNQITDFDANHLYYLTDTQGGSSGSPVFDDRGRLVGLHHWGGTPQEIAGKPPIKKNRGVRIPRVLAGLAAANIVVP